MVLKAQEESRDDPLRDPRLSNDLIARRAFEIGLIVGGNPDDNLARAEAELCTELASQGDQAKDLPAVG